MLFFILPSNSFCLFYLFLTQCIYYYKFSFPSRCSNVHAYPSFHYFISLSLTKSPSYSLGRKRPFDKRFKIKYQQQHQAQAARDHSRRLKFHMKRTGNYDELIKRGWGLGGAWLGPTLVRRHLYQNVRGECRFNGMPPLPFAVGFAVCLIAFFPQFCVTSFGRAMCYRKKKDLSHTYTMIVLLTGIAQSL